MSDLKEREVLAKARAVRLEAMPLVPYGSSDGGRRTLRQAIADVWQRRELIGMLVKREIRARYKDSALGFLWTLARPLTQLAIFYLVVGQFLGASRSIENFAVYVFAGITIYTLFSETLSQTTASIVGNAGLVKKVYLPREVFPLATVGSSLFNFGIQFVILVVFSMATGTLQLSWNLLYIPAAIVLTLVWATAIGLALSAFNVYLRDMQYLVEVVTMLLMWSSPIVYSWAAVRAMVPGIVQTIYVDNPVTLAVFGFQRGFWEAASHGVLPTHLGMRMLVATAVGLVALWIGHRIFLRLEGDFAQEL